jgi:hypothetical protein
MIGPTARSFPPATEPQGIGADLRFEEDSQRIHGELLAVQDTVFVLLSDAHRVVHVPISAIVVGRFTRRGTLIEDGWVSERSLAWLKLVSRFPAGLTPEISAKLLAMTGQAAPDWAP